MSGAPDRPTRMLVVDDHVMFRESVVRILDDQPDLEVVAVAGTIEAALLETVTAAPDVVLLDSRLPDGDGVTAARRIMELRNPPAIVFVTGFPDPATVRGARSAGCRAVISKDRSAHELVDAIRAAVRGESTTAVPDQPEAPASELSAREREVLACLSEGMSTAAMMERLFISRNTVRSHVQRVLDKLGAHSKLEAVAIARRDGLIA